MRVQYGAVLILALTGCSFDQSGLPGAGGDGGALTVDADRPDAPTPPDASIDGPPDARWPDCMTDSRFVGRPGSSHRYRAHTQTASYEGAQDACDDDDAYLVVIEDAAENTWVRGLQSNIQWIGLDDRGDEGVYEWANGVVLERGVDYENWASGEPNNFFGGEDCIEMTADGRWNDEGCDTAHRYICECDPGWSGDDGGGGDDDGPGGGGPGGGD